jgi:hypothetical protein
MMAGSANFSGVIGRLLLQVLVVTLIASTGETAQIEISRQVTICTTSLTFSNATFYPHSVFMCFVWISEQTAFISLHSIN